jgi:hypothetical protein
MTRRNIIVAAQATTLLAVIPVMMWGNLAGPPAGYSGATGEQNCAECHTSNNGGGSVTISFPNGLFYTPGTNQNWTVTIADEAGMSWGFQLTTRQAGTTTQVGSYQPGNDDYTQVLCANGYDPTATSPAIKQAFITVPGGTPCMTGYSYQWIEQTWNPSDPTGNPQNGARVGYPSPQSFTFGWNAPSTNVGNIDVFVAAVAGNGTDATSGGNVYINHYVLSVPVAGQPAIAAGGVVNGASYKPTIGPNTWVTIQGTNLANTTATASWNKNEPLATMLGGVSVTIGGTPTYVDYISPTQVNVPDAAHFGGGLEPERSVGEQHRRQLPGDGYCAGRGSRDVRVEIEICGGDADGFQLCRPCGIVSERDHDSGEGGDTIILWVTGLGTTNPPLPDGNLTPTLGGPYKTIHTPQVSIGGIGAQLVGAALAPGYAGLYQVAFVVPNGPEQRRSTDCDHFGQPFFT